jgi:hypothetical protein
MEGLWWIIAAVVLVAGFLFIRQQTKAGGRWGISLSRKSCPRCGTPAPLIRKPASKEEMLWGGWTCRNCGAKLDKYGRERDAIPPARS